MVKSYKGVESHEDTKKQHKRVRDYMTYNVIDLQPHQSIAQAMDVLIKHRISGAPVVDSHRKLIGVLSEGDCLKEIVKGRYSDLPNDCGSVEEHMTKNPTTMDPDTSILDAAQRFLNLRLRRFPVVEQGKLIGLITQSDIMKAVNDL